MLLEADWVLPVSGAPIAKGAILVLDGAIEDVGPAAELQARHAGESVRAFPGSVLMPGLVNTHTHLDYSAFRDFAPPSEFGEWMRLLLLTRRKLDLDDYAASALWGAHECVRGGVTCIGDTSFEGWTVARAAGSVGLRARVYLEVFGQDETELPATLAGLEARLGTLGDEFRRAAVVLGRVLFDAGISPHAPYTVSAELYREVARLVARSSLRMATHVAESPAEVEFLDQGTGTIPDAYREAGLWQGERFEPPGLSPVRYLSSNGILGRRTLAVHCVQVDDADIALLAESGTAVAHCPRSNTRLQCGSAPVSALLDAGVTVSLGTDSLSSNESLDMFAEMRAALAASGTRASGGALPDVTPDAIPDALTPVSVLRMATLDGARALGWGDLIGSLEKGKRADLIAVRLPEPSPWSDGRLETSPRELGPVETLVLQATAHDVAMTMIDGRLAYGTHSPDRGLSRSPEPLSEIDLEAAHAALSSVRAKLGLEDS